MRPICPFERRLTERERRPAHGWRYAPSASTLAAPIARGSRSSQDLQRSRTIPATRQALTGRESPDGAPETFPFGV
jgi:hypothetical protein